VGWSPEIYQRWQHKNANCPELGAIMQIDELKILLADLMIDNVDLRKKTDKQAREIEELRSELLNTGLSGKGEIAGNSG
jgi:dynactin complex subunit